MTQKLSIAELLRKNYPCEKYGDVERAAAEIGQTAKQFTRWRTGETRPNSEQTISLLDKMKMLKEVK